MSHIHAQHALPLSHVAFAIRSLDPPCEQLSDAASGSTARPMKLEICANHRPPKAGISCSNKSCAAPPRALVIYM